MEGTGPLAANTVSAPLGSHNAVLRGRSRTHFVREFAGPLSIKSVVEGSVAWKTGGRDLLVDSDSFLVLHQGEPYSMAIDAPAPVETLCVFFQEGFVESVHHALRQTALEPDFVPAHFAVRLHPRDQRILPRMCAIAASRSVSRLWLEEQYLELAYDLLSLDRDVARRLRLLPGLRPATRDELFRRVRRGQEYLHAHAGEDLDLQALARVACLSPYHFHRIFTRAFGKTPHHYRNGLRLARARRLLETTDRTVLEICGTVGFESPASFSLLFRQSFGMTPVAARKLSKIR